MATVQKFRRIFDKGEKIKLFFLLCAIIFGALLEMLALALISPFISVLIDNSTIQTNPYINWVFNFLGFNNITPFLALLTFLLGAIYLFRGIYMFLLNHFKFRFIAKKQAALSERLLSKFLGYSYLYHTKRNIAELQQTIVRDVDFMFGLLINIIRLLTDFFITFFILIFLVIVSPLMTLMIGVLALLCVFLYLKAFRKKIRDSGAKNRESSVGMTKAVNQAIGGIKEVKLLCRESYFQKAFKNSSNIFVKAFTQYRSLDIVPKLTIETVCFGGAFIVLGAFILGGADVSEMVPQLSVFVLAAFRLLPSVSRQVTYVNSIIFNRASVDAVYKSLFEDNDMAAMLPTEEVYDSGNDIVVRNLTFAYPDTVEPVLSDVSLVVPEKKSIAIIGMSGAGKTTLIDLILGVIAPHKGGIYYKNKSIHHNFEQWSKYIGYIPQQIYLLDESIRTNVAFGVERENIDDAKLWRALEQAQLKEFVESLPEGLETVVGDRGVRLSGGQRQRIGISRAMYEDPPILVLDEATSSLDNETEKAVMDAVMGFKGNKTMLIVAHRLSTIEHCDITYRVEDKGVREEEKK